MEDFEYYNPTKIIFGREAERKLPEEIKRLGFGKILLHYGGGSIKKTGMYNRIVKLLKDNNIEFVELPGVVPNPRLDKVREGIGLCRRHDVDFILAVGGGSVIDSGKAIALGINYKGDVWDFFEQKANPEEAEILPIGVVLTIPAAGSETSWATVISNIEANRKLSAKTNKMRPKFAVMNPELTFSLPWFQTAAGITDMIAHILERYFSNSKNVRVTDELCEGCLKSIIYNAGKAMEEPNSYEYRAELMLAGMIAHNGSLGMGRQEDWSSHGIEHELSAFYDITHGAGLAIIIPAWMKYIVNVKKHGLERFARFAEKVFGIEEGNEYEKAVKGIEKLENFFKGIKMPVRLKDIGIDDSKFEAMAENLISFRGAGNFVKLDKEDVIGIYKIALE